MESMKTHEVIELGPGPEDDAVIFAGTGDECRALAKELNRDQRTVRVDLAGANAKQLSALRMAAADRQEFAEENRESRIQQQLKERPW
jgi:hypothetical protein